MPESPAINIIINYCIIECDKEENGALTGVAEAVRSKTWVCGRWLAGIAGSNAAGDVDVCFLLVLCVVR